MWFILYHAHSHQPTRTNVVSQADYVMVMKGGQVSDFGPPNKMLDSADSELSLLMEELADTSSEDRGSVSNAAGGSKGDFDFELWIWDL